MRVLHLSNAGVYGGIESVLVAIARHRAACPALEHHFAVCFGGRLAAELEALGVTVYELGAAPIGRPASVVRARRRLRAVLTEHDFDVAICHGARSMVALAPAVRAAGLPLTMWVHGVKPRGHWLRWLLGRTPPDLGICCSQWVQEAFASLFPAVERTVIYAPVAGESTRLDRAERTALRRKLGADADTVVIVQAGRMVPLKGHLPLLDALAELHTETPWCCWIVGGAQAPRERAYQRELAKRIESRGLHPRVHLLGQRDDVPRLFSAADIYCQPNLRPESFGIVFIEAMQAGLPVVTSGLGGSPEAIDENSGVLVPVGSPGAVREVLREAIENADYRRSIGAGSEARARRLCDPSACLHDLHSALAAWR